MSELINIKENDINYYDESVKVLGKRNKERVIPLSKELIILIKKYSIEKRKNFNTNEIDYIIVTNKGSKCYPMMVYRTVKNYLDIFIALAKQ